jgi:uncharacterized repeat protein (TIGR03803 family)
MNKLFRHHLAAIAAAFAALHISTASAAVNFTTVFSFSFTNGAYPNASLLQGLDGGLYGTTPQGGAFSNGTVFRLDPADNSLTTVRSFGGTDDPESGVLIGNLVQGSDGTLYGTAGGIDDALGSLFRMATDGSNFARLFTFEVQTGFAGIGLLLGNDGALYGITNAGGPFGYGVTYRYDVAMGTFSTIYAFSASGAGSPYGNLIQDSNGTLYGTSLFTDGTTFPGGVYRMNADGSGFATLHVFNGADGATLAGALVLASDGFLYGVTQEGGTSNNGTVFRIRPDGTGFESVHSFNGVDGRDPFGGMIQGADGFLYGTTRGGGSSGNGTVFQIDPATGELTTLHQFNGADGDRPFATLIQTSDGALYGTTLGGGATGSGTIFRVVKTAAPTLPLVSCSSGFNGTAISAGRTVWFNSNLSVSNLNPDVTTTIRFLNQTIDGLPGGPVSVPDSAVVFRPGLANASETLSSGAWVINLPTRKLAGDAFLSGAAFAVPSGGLPGGIGPVTWSGSFTTDQPGVQVKWKWGAAVYTQFSTSTPREGGVSVKSVDDNKADLLFKNSDHAGTPENFKNFVTGGARGGGGSNYTGSWSGTCTVSPSFFP